MQIAKSERVRRSRAEVGEVKGVEDAFWGVCRILFVLCVFFVRCCVCFIVLGVFACVCLLFFGGFSGRLLMFLGVLW